MNLPLCDNLSKTELFFYVVDQFLDSMSNDPLHLSTGASHYSKFRMVVEGSLCFSWQTLLAVQANKMNNSFMEDLQAFADQFFAPTA